MNHWWKKATTLTLTLMLVFTASACGGNKEQETGNKEITLMLDWVPNTNHTGLYVALEKGYFSEEGLDVKIETPGETSAPQLVGAGEADFGISSQEYITQARAEGIPIVSIAAILQHNTSGFASPKEKKITSPADFVGKTYGGWGTPMENAFLKTVLEKKGIPTKKVEDKINIVNMGEADFFTATKRDIDFSWIYYGWTGVEAEQRDIPLNMMYLTDLDPSLDFYTPAIIASEKTVQSDQETATKFMRAVSKGYKFAIEQPGDAADILVKYTPESDPELIKASQKWMSRHYQADAAKWGWQEKEKWAQFTDWMVDNQLIKNQISSDEAFTNQFLPE
ncbi:ABC transporter substrate-binding protein [Mechercharimyces sp. CAU 1602]|uniref:ABC transporter substrate-binding protein n=1 Tax=Mechercharimyces sp. CAU 1602 TaxID=2973933 RepID=UPI0021630634|nr:ABC transporter substrate-binding protein [Mechercharimyces sp. CAU 1602]MCS1352337.1 ABC transporter substrate-binding protein [Mechercharimyces sp. CAU 1602]